MTEPIDSNNNVRPPEARGPRWLRVARGYFDATAFVVGATAFGFVLSGVMDPAHVLLVYLAPVIVVAINFGFGPAAWAAALSVLATSYFFAAPIFSVAVADPGTVWALIVFVAVAAGVTLLADQVRRQTDGARAAEKTIRRLYKFSEELAGIVGVDELLASAVAHIHNMMGGEIFVLMPNAAGKIEEKAAYPARVRLGPADIDAAQWCFEKNEPAGGDLRYWPKATCKFLPLLAGEGLVGVLAARKEAAGGYLSTDDQVLLGASASLAAIAVERATMARRLDEARLAKETEEFRSALLSSLTHDFRTPLASIVGSLSSLRHFGNLYDDQTQGDLLANAQSEAERLNRYIENLLNVTRLDTGNLRRNLELIDIDDVIGASLKRAENELREHKIQLDIAREMPMARLDFVLCEQAIFNLLENASKYAPAGSTVSIGANCADGRLRITVADEGPGIPPEHAVRIFDRFYRIKMGDRQRAGIGLGLAVARGFIEAIGGTLTVRNRSSGGACFTIEFPAPEPVRGKMADVT